MELTITLTVPDGTTETEVKRALGAAVGTHLSHTNFSDDDDDREELALFEALGKQETSA